MVNVTLLPDGNIATLHDGTEYIYNLGSMAYMIVGTFLVLLMIPGLGLFYSGLSNSKNATTQLWLNAATYSVAAFQWGFWGFSLAFSETGSVFVRDLKNAFLMNTDIQPSTGSSTIPQLLYCIYQMQFAAITPCIAVGAFGDRCRMLPVMIWVFCWQTVVYCPIAASTWNLGGVSPPGWLASLGVLDFAGGGPVHLSSASAALAISVFLGHRRGYGTEALASRPHNVTNVFLGMFLLFCGWLGFNGASGLSASLRAVMANLVTLTATITGGMTWAIIDYFTVERKWSVVGFSSGAVCGLVAITPASGYVAWGPSLAIGAVGAAAANFGTSFKNLIRVDDSLDIWACHGFAAISGSLSTGIWADSRVASFDGSVQPALGWLNHHWIQLPIQMAEVGFVFGWSFTVSMILLFIIDRIPGLHFRISEEDELIGLDLAEVGEQEFFLPRHFIEDLEIAPALETTPMLEKQDAHSSPSGSESEHKENLEQPTSEIREAMA